MLRRLRSLSPSHGLLLAWLLFCLAWTLLARKPWDTRAFAIGGVKQVPLREYQAAGLWIGFLLSGLLAAALLPLQRWCASPLPSPVHPTPPRSAFPLPAFAFALLALLAFALTQRWPAMSLSFWGDEGWMFCDFVHGKWQPAIKGASLQGDLRFNAVDWPQTLFGDQSGNNHWLASILQRATLKTWQYLTHRPLWAFEESIVRLPSLAAGLGSLAALAGWLRWLGRPLTGLLAAALMALHPWHLRFSVEARGYSLMLLFLILTLWALSAALRSGRQRHWLLFALAQFLTLYAWKGSLYPLAAINTLLALRLLCRPLPSPRPLALARWLSASLLGALLFLPLALPSQLQIRKSIEEVRHRAKPMESAWLHDAIAESLVGIPWMEQDPANPRGISLQRLAQLSPTPWPALAATLLLLALGAAKLWRLDPFLAALSAALLASAPLAAAHFKYALHVELLTWYLLYSLPILALLAATALLPRRSPSSPRALLAASLAPAAALASFASLAAPLARDLHRFPRENLQQAWQLTRGAHEPPGFSSPSPIYTAYLWRHSFAYEPRADLYVRSQAALDAKINLARANHGQFYFIVGIRDLSQALCPDVMQSLQNPQLFDHLTTLWGVESLNTLDVYRLRTPTSPL